MTKGKEAGQRGAQPKDKGKEATTLLEAKGKKAATKVKGVDSKAKDDTTRAKDDPPIAKV